MILIITAAMASSHPARINTSMVPAGLPRPRRDRQKEVVVLPWASPGGDWTSVGRVKNSTNEFGDEPKIWKTHKECFKNVGG
jgi:hypothetical protein